MPRSKTIGVKRTWRGGVITAAMQPAAASATYLGAELLRTYSLEEVPVETGALGDSAHVIPGTADNPSSTLVYDSIYAAAQHEIPMNHTPGKNGEPAGKDHFVSDPMREHRAEIYGVMAKRMRKALNG